MKIRITFFTVLLLAATQYLSFDIGRDWERCKDYAGPMGFLPRAAENVKVIKPNMIWFNWRHQTYICLIGEVSYHFYNVSDIIGDITEPKQTPKDSIRI